MKQWFIENAMGISFWALIIIIGLAAEACSWWLAVIAIIGLAGLVKLMNRFAEKMGLDKKEEA